MEAPMFWLELITTGNSYKYLGSNPNKDIILEVATAITDASLDKVIIGPQAIIQANKDTAYKDCKLLEEAYKSTKTIEEIEEKLLKFVKETVKDTKVELAGKHCSKTREFLVKYMPTLNEALDYHNVDLRSILYCCNIWTHKYFELKESERAEEALMEGIEVLRKVKALIFHH